MPTLDIANSAPSEAIAPPIQIQTTIGFTMTFTVALDHQAEIEVHRRPRPHLWCANRLLRHRVIVEARPHYRRDLPTLPDAERRFDELAVWLTGTSRR
jgi:hypothetical protein